MAKKKITIEIFDEGDAIRTSTTLEGLHEYEVLGILTEALMRVEVGIKNRFIKDVKNGKKTTKTDTDDKGSRSPSVTG